MTLTISGSRLAILAIGFVGGVLFTAALPRAAAQQPGIGQEQKFKMPTPLELLTLRVSNLEKNSTITSKRFDSKIEQVRAEIQGVRDELKETDKLAKKTWWEVAAPEGQLGLKRHLVQKKMFDENVSQYAWVLYYDR